MRVLTETQRNIALDDIGKAIKIMRQVFSIVAGIELMYGVEDNGDDELYELIYMAGGLDSAHAEGILRHYEAILHENMEDDEWGRR